MGGVLYSGSNQPLIYMAIRVCCLGTCQAKL